MSRIPDTDKNQQKFKIERDTIFTSASTHFEAAWAWCFIFESLWLGEDHNLMDRKSASAANDRHIRELATVKVPEMTVRFLVRQNDVQKSLLEEATWKFRNFRSRHSRCCSLDLINWLWAKESSSQMRMKNGYEMYLEINKYVSRVVRFASSSEGVISYRVVMKYVVWGW